MAKPKPKKKAPRPVVAYEPKGYEPKRIFQQIKSEKLFELLDFDPAYVPWMYIENIIQRVFARIILQGPYGPIVAKGTKDGSLAVVARGGAFDDYQKLEHFYSAAAEEKVFQFTRQVTRIDIFTWDGLIDYQLSRDLVKAYGSKLTLFEDSFYSLDFDTLRVKATSQTFNPRGAGTATATLANHLVDAAATFQTWGVKVGDFVVNLTDKTVASVTAVNSEINLTLSLNIFVSGETYAINSTRSMIVGWFRTEE